MAAAPTRPLSWSDARAAFDEIERRLAALEQGLARRTPNTTPEWGEPRWYENSVQLALGKLLGYGDLAFDVGANIGIIAAMMGAAVGPFGRVVAFEASPRTIGQLHVNLNYSNAFNVTVVHAAVAERTGQLLPVFYGADTPADTIFGESERTPDAHVPSISLDDYVARLGAPPRVVKIDIEGAELLALQGFRDTLARHRPALVIETLSSDPTVDELLQSFGYDLSVDVGNFARFDKRAATGHYLANILYLHKDEERGQIFRAPRRAEAARFSASDLRQRGDELRLELGALASGLYVLHLDFAAAAADLQELMEVRVGSPDRQHALYVAPAWHLALAYRAIPFEFDREAPAFVSLTRVAPDTVRGVLPAFRLERLEG